MVMNLVLGGWENLSLKSGCNLYSKNFRFCVLTVKKVHESLNRSPTTVASVIINASSSSSITPTNMYFRERDRPAVDIDTFLATALPKMLMAALIIFLNCLAILGLVRSNRWMSSIRSSGGKGFYFLPQSTQGLLHSLFLAYLALGVLTLYSEVSLSAFVLLEFRFVEDQGFECLVVNCVIIALSIAISLHLISLAVDRTLASCLSYARYTDMSRGTVPLWLLAIWLPSCIIGVLPLAGWRTTFSFCIFLQQFNDDYLRFVGGFHLAAICSIPLIYCHFKCCLKQEPVELGTLYRWHRKLQSHHRLTFTSTLALNTICWTPFHLYLLLACQSCPFPAYGAGFLQEYLFIVALIPAMGIPMVFTIRSSVLDQCATRIARLVRYRGTTGTTDTITTLDTNPLSRHTITRKSPLFCIDEMRTSTTGSSSIYRDTLTAKQKGNLFVPRYLPSQHVNTTVTAIHGESGPLTRSGRYIKNQRHSGRRLQQASYANKCFEREQVYSNNAVIHSHSPSTQETETTDSQCGFPRANQPSYTATFSHDEQLHNYQEEPYYSQILSHTLPRTAC